MTTTNVVAALMVVTMSLSAASTAQAGEREMKRPTILPTLYATLGAIQGWDVYSTRIALRAGAREANSIVAPVAGNTGALVGVKVATTASTIFFAERVWRKNKVAAIVMLAGINGATAAVSLRNMRHARRAATRQ